MILREGRSPAPVNSRALRAMQMQTNKAKRCLRRYHVIVLWRTASAPNSCEKRRIELNATGSLRGRAQGAGAARACFYSAEDLQHQGTCYTVCRYGGGAGGPGGEAILHYLCANSGAQGGNLRPRRPPKNALNLRANCSARLHPISPAARCRRQRQHRRHLRRSRPTEALNPDGALNFSQL